jgi:AraC family transcriptional regulator, positive regulator of tynA and feaB
MPSWSSSDVRPRDRLPLWVDLLRTFMHVQCESGRDERFFAEISCDRLGDIQVASARTTAQHVRRTSHDLARDPAEFLHICVLRSGRTFLSQDRREAELGPGDFVLSDSVRPFSLSVDDDYSVSLLQIPRQMLSHRVGAAERFTAIRVDGTNGIGGMLSPMLREVPLRLAAVPEAARVRIADNLLDLVAAALLSTGDGASLSARLTLTRVKFWIETHLAEKLSGTQIAGGCQLSERHLNRLFKSEGTSVMRYVWERRLERCRRDLADPALCHRSITAIAFAAGFNDPSHFSRAYRAHYGTTPREERGKA